MKRFVLGDIHGMYDYLIEVLEKSGFDYENDLLIQIGDIVDRGPEPFKCMDELLKIKNLILIRGNHDEAFTSKIWTGDSFLGDFSQNGQMITMEKWNDLSPEERMKYGLEIFEKQVNYHISDDNIMFVHGGFPRDEKLEEVVSHVFYWDRELWNQALSCKGDVKLKNIYDFKEIFIGHTPTIYWEQKTPMYSGGVWNIDTGSGKGGPLTIMNIDTKEYFQSTDNIIIMKNKILKVNE